MQNKTVDKTIELSAWTVTILLLIKFVPKRRIREAIIPFFFKQCITWIFGLMVVEKRLISYPIRLFFNRATKSSFTFEYFVYPSLCVLFNLYYPKKSNNVQKLLYYFFHTAIITCFEIYAVKFTKLIKYDKWSWYWSFASIWVTYYLSHIFYQWYFKNGVSNKKMVTSAEPSS
ncbi:hypothetical protein OEV98_15075 [Caldibacillus lycopersici]|uniref:Uncharacterized protein n=1 Tax=Perspicuibacillus lycopersici TaxID=1325689 RepID=A0AAE3IZD7_9BACI|nr:CBO0543 family protein [Perspicuibacillus lycopersici]MCU9614865.1 hypothetical protein [Perspicuibacillus lycopersici]